MSARSPAQVHGESRGSGVPLESSDERGELVDDDTDVVDGLPSVAGVALVLVGVGLGEVGWRPVNRVA